LSTRKNNVSSLSKKLPNNTILSPPGPSSMVHCITTDPNGESIISGSCPILWSVLAYLKGAIVSEASAFDVIGVPGEQVALIRSMIAADHKDC
jgi:hypothetical protein